MSCSLLNSIMDVVRSNMAFVVLLLPPPLLLLLLLSTTTTLPVASSAVDGTILLSYQ